MSVPEHIGPRACRSHSYGRSDRFDRSGGDLDIGRVFPGTDEPFHGNDEPGSRNAGTQPRNDRNVGSDPHDLLSGVDEEEEAAAAAL